MRWSIGLVVPWLLTGCQVLFPRDEQAQPGSETVCAGQFTDTPMLTACGTTARVALDPMPDIDTDADCDLVIPQEDLDGTELCVIGAKQVTIGTTKARGSRPLVLVAIGELRITGKLSVASRFGDPDGAGANFGRCSNSQAGGESLFGFNAGGGAGGSFQSEGGPGGTADEPGGIAGDSEPTLGFVRGGCRGGDGGRSTSPFPFEALGGAGGGALYLLAGEAIVIEGIVDASGAGGGPGAEGDDSGGNNLGGSGGGGGGSGGLIALDAPQIDVTADGVLVANGGGGGGGGPGDTNGMANPGSEADGSGTSPYLAAGGGSDGAGEGGDGATKDDVAQAGSPSNGTVSGGGGGGGGGLGHILTFGPVTNLGGFSPAITNLER